LIAAVMLAAESEVLVASTKVPVVALVHEFEPELTAVKVNALLAVPPE
jgi:hypothetical protein